MTEIEELLRELDQLAYRVDRMPLIDVEAKLNRVSAELRKRFVALESRNRALESWVSTHLTRHSCGVGAVSDCPACQKDAAEQGYETP